MCKPLTLKCAEVGLSNPSRLLQKICWGQLSGYIAQPEAITWWRHQMETFSALLALCAGNSRVTGEFPTQRPVTQIFDVFFDPRLNKRLSKQSWGWWFETSSCPLWRHLNEHGEILNYVSHSTVMWSIIIQNAPKAHKPLSHIHVRSMSVIKSFSIFFTEYNSITVMLSA